MRHQNRVKRRVSRQVARGATRRVQGRPVPFVGSLFRVRPGPPLRLLWGGHACSLPGVSLRAPRWPRVVSCRDRRRGALGSRTGRDDEESLGSGPDSAGPASSPAGAVLPRPPHPRRKWPPEARRSGWWEGANPPPWYRQVSARSSSGFPNPACTSGVGNAQVAPGSGTLSGCHSSPSPTLSKLPCSPQRRCQRSRALHFLPPPFSPRPAPPRPLFRMPRNLKEEAAVGRWTGIQRPPQHDTTPRELRLVGILPCSRPQQETRDSSRRTTPHAETFEEFCAGT
ncbi:uncharacterized protein LOC125159530 isoform X1 [Prionailurus viverrinus]|uniref:uncharacterized protein LOC125159530 isoform X1 n=1 Tax=Prionailurus viverrinus TaxID=61388 RepID=UPI001FF30FB4|nr:uncharacterized protein LOC125159530 isoform X1 [Prionailurus viverrinus]